MTETHLSPPANESERQSFLANGKLIVVGIALAKLAFHCCFNNRYDYFRNEFDYVACGNHLAWGNVDQPPLISFRIHICRRSLRARAADSCFYMPGSEIRDIGGSVAEREQVALRRSRFPETRCALLSPASGG